MIQSVRRQSYPYWELCLADGGEEDEKTRQVICEYQRKDKRIQYQKLQRNRGIAQNTNEAMDMATGDYLAFLRS